MIAFDALSIWSNVVLLLAAAAVITVAGVRMSGLADRLADVTGMGEAVTGAVFLGASTSLPGIVASVTAAAGNYPQLAMSNAIGGIAAQTFFIGLADFAYRKANLEHAAASVTNLINGTLLVSLLSIPLLAFTTPEIAFYGVHPATPALLLFYGFGLKLASRTHHEPMWGPRETAETEVDVPDEPPGDRRSVIRVCIGFAGLAAVVGIAGWVVARSGIAITQQANLSEGLVGTLFTAVATSMPELVTTLSAVRRGALTLAVGGILGGNTFDVLFIAFSDIAYREGSIYHAMANEQVFIIVLTILMTTILLLGLLRRETHGIANVGFESASILALYAVGVSVLVLVW